MHHRLLRGAATGGLALALSVAVAACGSGSSSSSSGSGPSSGSSSTATPAASGPGKGKPAFTLGAKNFTEEFILGQLYTQALEAKGYTVNLKNNIGSSEVIDKALTSGQIDGYPDYTGTILSAIANQPRPPASAQAAYQQAKAFEAKRGFTLLNDTPFVDSDVLGVLPAYAQSHGLSSIADLKKLGTSVTIGGPPENATRFNGMVGLRQLYGVTATFKPLAIGLQYPALDNGQVQVSTLFTTDGQLSRKHYVQLKDPKAVFGFQNVAFVANAKKLAAEGPAFAQTINAVSAKLTTPAVQQMNAAADLDKRSAADVAKAFLQANGLG